MTRAKAIGFIERVMREIEERKATKRRKEIWLELLNEAIAEANEP